MSTLQELLAHPALGLRLVSEPGTPTDVPVRWVHSSDLADPTPFLADDLVLLTTGTQLQEDDPAGVADYVARLRRRGVAALGYGTRVYRSGIPAELIAACASERMPLFEVPYETPFIAVARAHAEAIAEQAYARRTWALEAQRALAGAALRPAGLESMLTELARRLEVWVGLIDATGTVVHRHPDRGLSPEGVTAVAEHAAVLLTRGAPAAEAVEADERTVTVFTLGPGGALRGAVAIGTTQWDAESRAVATSAVAMADVVLAQRDRLLVERRRLRSQVLASLMHDDPALARDVLDALPEAPVLVAVAAPDAKADAVETWAADRDALVAEGPDGIVLCLPAAQESALDDAAGRLGIRLGVSEPAGYDAFSRAHAQALSALGRARAGALRFADAIDDSILTALATDEARLVAAARLAPLRTHDGLEEALRVWLEHDAHIERAAATLGIHRHTLRTRIAQAGALLRTDLSSFPARAELWAALQAVR